MRYIPFLTIILVNIACVLLALSVSAHWLWPLLLFSPLLILGLYDIIQSGHTLWRLYPVSAHVRWFFEWLRPFMREYLLDSNFQGRPFSHDQRAVIYKRAKDDEGVQAFGTDMDLYESGYEWINHAIQAEPCVDDDFRVRIGGDDCTKPYSASVLNVSAMSFGSLSGRAVEALNLAARMGNFYHDTGEGGISSYHLKHGGDLVWEIGTGYFGCRTDKGEFDLAKFADNAARDEIKMIEIKLSQGAKPGGGGILPGPKVTPEIAAVRGVLPYHEIHSPPYHSAFSTPVGLMEWIAELREAAGGKPVGFKLCLGHRWEFLALMKAIHKCGIKPDFIVIDGAEGGTGAAPMELSDHVGTPLREGLVFVNNALTATNLRKDIRIGVAGKVYNGHTMAASMALGADWCNAARGFMFAIGCVQTKKCHTDKCPTGITTQDKLRQSGLVVADKGPRAFHFHKNTVHALAQYVAAAGLADPSELKPHHLRIRDTDNQVRSADRIYDMLAPGILMDAPEETIYERWWAMADADSFKPCDIPHTHEGN